MNMNIARRLFSEVSLAIAMVTLTLGATVIAHVENSQLGTGITLGFAAMLIGMAILLGRTGLEIRRPRVVEYPISVVMNGEYFTRAVPLPFLPAVGQELTLWVDDKLSYSLTVKNVKWTEGDSPGDDGYWFIEMEELDHDPHGLEYFRRDPEWA